MSTDHQEETLPDPAPPADLLSTESAAIRPSGERPIMVYFVLLVGIATLVGLIAIVWISATGGGGDERPICTEITAEAARDAILAGDVERLNVLVDRENPLSSLTGIVLDFKDGSCRQTRQGADVRNDLYMVVGAAEFYNNFAEKAVRIQYQQQAIDPGLLVTATPTPTVTPTIETIDVPETPTPEPAATNVETVPSPSPTLEPVATATTNP